MGASQSGDMAGNGSLASNMQGYSQSMSRDAKDAFIKAAIAENKVVAFSKTY